MKEVSKDVFMKINGVKTKVGTATVKAAETIEEALELHGETKVLSLVNSQHLTNRMNEIRGDARSGPGKKKLENEAWKRISADELQSVAGDPDAIRSLLDRKITEIERERLSSVGN